MQINFLRHAGWFGPEDGETINIIGVGATGSWVGMLAARIGFHNFRVWDHDIVESHNPPNQIYTINQIGKLKVDAFEECLKEFNNEVKVEKYNDLFTTEKYKDILDGPLVLTVDTMSARKDIYDSFAYNWHIPAVFETRLGFDFAQLSIIDNLCAPSLESWKATLKDDKEIEEGPCNLRICTTLVTLIASLVVQNLGNLCSAKRREQVFTGNQKVLVTLNDKLEVHNLEVS